jgi:hypothetical protein
MTNNEALIKSIFGIILVIGTIFIGAVVGAFIGAIRGPYFILSKIDGGEKGLETKVEKTDTSDRI